MRTTTMRRNAAVALAAGTVLAGGLATAPPASAASFYGCQDGNACLYKSDSLASGVMYAYYNYGSYNLSNVYGRHFFVNQQTGGAKAYLCTGYNGGGTCTLIPALHYGNYDFTPINSIKLTP